MKADSAHWRVLTPPTWPAPPPEMSVSMHAAIDECPRRWALSAAEYPDIWSGRGYPPKLQAAALAGSVVHLALEIITKQLTCAGVPSLNDPSATQVLKELGGYTRVVEDCVERILKRFSDNPRALPLMEHAQRTLRGQVPTLRARVQSMLARLRLPKGASPTPTTSAVKTAGPPTRSPLANGTYPEVEVRAKSIGWRGKIDLLVLGDDACEITDFKTGVPDEHHKFQVRVYALLWSRDADVNPDRRRADRLVLAYEHGDVEVEAPSDADLDQLERHLTAQTAAALVSLSQKPPEAKPHPQQCPSCDVRHLCTEYWTRETQHLMGTALRERHIADATLAITGAHGPSSWDGLIVSGAIAKKGQRVLLRADGRSLALLPSQVVRVLSAHVSGTPEDDDSESVLIFTLVATSEVFLVP